jgi:hypothetical protein
MKQIISNIKKSGLVVLLMAGLNACNKEVDATKAISIEIKGFNIGNAELQITVDTLVYRNFQVAPNEELNFGKVFTYPSSKNEVTLKIKDLISGKDVYQQQLVLNNSDLERFFQFVLIDGHQLEVKPPAADPATNKVGFYIHYPQSSDLIDIYIKNEEGQLVNLAQNVPPSTWVYTDYLTQQGFENPNTNYDIIFTRAGTTDVWAFNDNEYMSQTSEDAMFLPQNGQKGLVCSYFVTPGSIDLRLVRLFKRPE